MIQVADKSSGEKNSNFLEIGRVRRMGQKKGGFTAKSSVKTTSGRKLFVQMLTFRGRFIFLVNVLVFSNKGSEGLPRQVFRVLIDSLDN